MQALESLRAALGSAPPADAAQPLGLADVLEGEYAALTGTPAFTRAGPPDLPPLTSQQRIDCVRAANLARGTTALCLSGGGIRSASFCLGVVQALGRKGLIGKFDYLSTVSGGGYAGALLAAWIYRSPRGVDDAEAGLADPDSSPAKPIDWLRAYLSYLAPRRGLFSIDTWTLLVTYVRNLSLNLLILLPVLAAVLLVPFLAASVSDQSTAWVARHAWADWTGVGALLLGLVLVATATGSLRTPDDVREMLGVALDNVDIQVMLALGAFAIGFGWVVMHSTIEQPFWVAWEAAIEGELPAAASAFLRYKAPVLFALVWAVCAFSGTLGYIGTLRFHLPGKVGAGIAAVVCGAVTGLLAYATLTLLTPDGGRFDEDAWRLMLTLAPPGLLLSIGIGEVLFIGALSRAASDYDREWSARAGAWTSMLALAWLLLFAISFYGPWALDYIRQAGISTSSLYALLSGAGAVLARIAFRMSPEREGEKGIARLPPLRERTVDLLSALFILALLIGIADGVDFAVHHADSFLPASWSAGDDSARSFTTSGAVAVGVALLAVILIAGFCVNINKFSLHAMYRDRLIRTFLGASRANYVPPPRPLDVDWDEPRQYTARMANRFTNLDRDDNPHLHWLAAQRAGAERDPRKRPFLLVSAALNLVGGRNLAWQERKAASFTFSPMHTGSALLHVGYRPTAEFASESGGLTLGTAIATSGAAVSPNAGYTSSPLRTFLLALFNARLGWWLGNPNKPKAVRRAGPPLAVFSLLRELLGLTNELGNWLFVSDGGHFDNLGLYEAVSRGCRHIVAVDASCDPDRNYDDLGNAIRKIRIDLGVPIERDELWRIGGRDLQAQGRYCALLPIRYDLAWGAPEPGFLLYIKPALYSQALGLPVDILQYAGRSLRFPHEPTTNQFFTESQFESYRALGDYELEAITAYQARVGSVVDLIDLGGVHARIDRMATRRQT